MSPDPNQVLHDLGVDPASIRRVDTLSERHGHAIWRLVTAEGSYIVKWLPEAAARVEVGGYLLLRQLGVPTLPLYGSTAQALLLEDLTRSEMWRLATPDDLTRPEVGRAVARWYRVFHDAGEALLSKGDRPGFLAHETDELDRNSMLAAGQSLGLRDCRAWDLAVEHIELLRAAADRLSTTLNYNDFYWTNLALTSREHGPEVVVFDYHLLGVGMRYSDCRNVTSSLSADAGPAFWEAYGSVDSREGKLDRPLATLWTLNAASRLTKFPKWAEASRDSVVEGDLERDLVEAIELARSLSPNPNNDD